MKRHLATILIFLILGAILNVAVAWGICLWGDPLKIVAYPPSNAIVEDGFLSIGQDDVYCIRIENAVYLRALGTWTRSSLSRKSVLDLLIRGEPLPLSWEDLRRDSNLSMDGPYSILPVVVGWPVFTMWFETVNTPSSAVPDIEHGLILKQLPAWRVKPAVGIAACALPRTVPLGIYYRGFLINTFFYAMLLWLLFPGRYMLRRRRRIRRGLCGRCGYVVSVNVGIPGASPNCTECGTPISLPGTPKKKSIHHRVSEDTDRYT